MKKKRINFARRITRRMLLWGTIVLIALTAVILHLEGQATRAFYTEIYHNKMLVNYEYTRRVISDVYVAVTNNIYHIEHSLDDPHGHKDTMERIVSSGTRVRSCGISFIENYYPALGHNFCPYAWRNVANPDEIRKENLVDASLDYFESQWFLDVLKTDSAQWSEPFYDGQDKKTTLSAYMAPIHDASGRVVAVLGADISLDWLTGKLAEIDSTMNDNAMLMAARFGLKSRSLIINHDGSFITHADDQRIMRDNFFDELASCGGSDVNSLVENIKAGIMPEGSRRDKYLVDGEECYVFYTPVKYTRWNIIALVPCYAIDLIAFINGVSVVVVFLLALLIVAMITYFYIRNGMAQVKHLSQAVDNITKGHFDTPMPEMKYRDEICELRDSVEKMQYTLSNLADKPQKQ